MCDDRFGTYPEHSLMFRHVGMHYDISLKSLQQRLVSLFSFSTFGSYRSWSTEQNSVWSYDTSDEVKQFETTFDVVQLILWS